MPSAEEAAAEIADGGRRAEAPALEPKVALLSHSNFRQRPVHRRMREASRPSPQHKAPDLQCDGEYGDSALSRRSASVAPGFDLHGEATRCDAQLTPPTRLQPACRCPRRRRVGGPVPPARPVVYIRPRRWRPCVIGQHHVWRTLLWSSAAKPAGSSSPCRHRGTINAHLRYNRVSRCSARGDAAMTHRSVSDRVGGPEVLP